GSLSCPRVLVPLAPRYVLCCLICSALQAGRCSWAGLLDRTCRRHKAHGDKGRCRRSRVLGPVQPSGQVFGGNVLRFALRQGLHGRGKWLSTPYVPIRSVGPFRGRSQASVIGCSLGERPNNAHTTLSVTPNFFLGQMVVVGDRWRRAGHGTNCVGGGGVS